MSDKLGPLAFGKRDEMIFLGREIGEQRNYSDDVAKMIDEEVRALVERRLRPGDAGPHRKPAAAAGPGRQANRRGDRRRRGIRDSSSAICRQRKTSTVLCPSASPRASRWPTTRHPHRTWLRPPLRRAQTRVRARPRTNRAREIGLRRVHNRTASAARWRPEMTDELASYLDRTREQRLESFKALLRIPSISGIPAHAPDCRAAAEFVAADMRAIGLNHVDVSDTGGHPVVYGDWLGAPGMPTVLVYGHYDVQPVDPLDLWESPPFEPVVRDGRMLARGASDDKAQIHMHLRAIEALLATRRQAARQRQARLRGRGGIRARSTSTPGSKPIALGSKPILPLFPIRVSSRATCRRSR